MKKLITIGIIVIAISLILGAASSRDASAATIELTFAWDKNTEADLAGYRLYMSSTSGAYTKGETSPNFLMHVLVAPPLHPNTAVRQIIGAEGQKFYFVLTAYDLTGNESGLSNEVSYTIPDTTPPAPPKNFLVTLWRLILSFLRGLSGGLHVTG